jgi:hypothetical protein
LKLYSNGTIHHSRKGSSPGLRAGLYVSDSGYDEKFEVSLGALNFINYSNNENILNNWLIGNWYFLLGK